MRYVVAAVLGLVALVLGAVVYDIGETIAKRALGLQGIKHDLVGYAAALVAVVGFLALCWLGVQRTFKRCSQCDSYIRKPALRCVYCKADVA